MHADGREVRRAGLPARRRRRPVRVRPAPVARRLHLRSAPRSRTASSSTSTTCTSTSSIRCVDPQRALHAADGAGLLDPHEAGVARRARVPERQGLGDLLTDCPRSSPKSGPRCASSPARQGGDPARYFKTGPGEYGEGDRFLGLTVPQVRVLVRRFHPVEWAALPLIRSPIHEERRLGLRFLVERYRRGTPPSANGAPAVRAALSPHQQLGPRRRHRRARRRPAPRARARRALAWARRGASGTAESRCCRRSAASRRAASANRSGSSGASCKRPGGPDAQGDRLDAARDRQARPARRLERFLEACTRRGCRGRCCATRSSASRSASGRRT